jgi:hypothetical protein
MGEHVSNTFVTHSGWRRFAALAACGLLGLLWSDLCAAEERDRDCSAVYDAGLEQEQAGHLREAQSIYQNCAIDSCSDPVRHTCEAKALRLELDAPSVVPLAKDANGEPLVDAVVTLDGAELTSHLDGRALSVDPGLHEFVWSAGGTTIGSLRVVIAQGERNRELMMAVVPATTREPIAPQPSAAEPAAPVAPRVAPKAALPAPRAATAATPERSISLTPYVLGGTALLGAGAYALLSSWARGDNAALGRCSPNCSQDSVSHVRALYIAADISLGVAAAAAIGSIASFTLFGASSEHEPAPRRSFALSVQPERTGALATVRGTL